MVRARNRSDAAQRPLRTPVFEPIVPLPSECFVWRRDDYPMPWSAWNSHPECEIHLIGNAEGISYVGDHIGPFKPGDLFFVGRNLPHDWVTPLRPGDVIAQRDILVQFDEERLLAAADAFPELQRLERLLQMGRRGLSFYGQARREGEALLNAIGLAAGVRRLSLLLELLHLLSTTPEVRLLSSDGFRPNPNTEAKGILRNALQYLATHFDEDVKLADLAKVAGMTETSFSRFFKKNTGNTFTRHLSELRTGKACELLAYTDKPITDICHDVGYLNISNFNRAFRSLRNMAPSQYRLLARR